MDKIILVGHPGSQQIVKVGKYLLGKYMPNFEAHWLSHDGNIDEWSNHIRIYLKSLEDEFIVFALDDYLVSGFNKDIYTLAKARLKHEIVAVKLCETNPQEQAEYPVTTQFTVWRRTSLMNLLEWTTNPWDFEVSGSRRFPEMNMESLHGYPAITYDTHSALSKKWEGVNWKGVKAQDMEYIFNKKLI